MLTKYKYLALAVILLSIAGGSFWAGWKEHSLRTDSANLKAVELARQEERATARKQVEASEKMLAALQASKNKTRTLTHEVLKIEYRDRECFDDALVRTINAAAGSALAAVPDLPGIPAAPP